MVLPSVCPRNTANTSDRKTAEEIQRAMGCCKFHNHKHILQMSWDGEWVDGEKFPPSLGSFVTIPKGQCGKRLEKTRYRYLDAVPVDIAFGPTGLLRRSIAPWVVASFTTSNIFYKSVGMVNGLTLGSSRVLLALLSQFLKGSAASHRTGQGIGA
jgi:hypothetical protein